MLRASGRRGRRRSKNGGAAASLPLCRAHQAAGAGGAPKMEGQRPRCPYAARISPLGRRPSVTISIAIPIPIPKHGGATASLPFYPARMSPPGRRPSIRIGDLARIRPPGPAALQKWRGSGLVALMPRASGRRGPRRSKNGGAAASLPFYPARTSPPGPAALPSRRIQAVPYLGG